MKNKKIRYGVIGLGHIAQAAVLPAFKNTKNSVLRALISSDKTKLKELGRRYNVTQLFHYDDFDTLLQSGEVDAIYNALPNHEHAEYTIRALRAGIPVLCEKPMAVSSKECLQMIKASEQTGAKLMIAYRLHFEESNLKAIEIAKSKLGELRFFNSSFAFTPKPGNIRLYDESLGGGPLYDIGVYCINASRYLFRDEPIEVFATAVSSGRKRSEKIHDTISAVLKYPNERLASFTVSFSTAPVTNYQIVGSNGDLFVDQAYDYEAEITHKLTLGGKTKEKTFPKRDHFAPELEYFAKCILKNKTPEPSGYEGLADVRIIEALYRSISAGKPVRLERFSKGQYPERVQELRRPAVKQPKLVKVEEPIDEAA